MPVKLTQTKTKTLAQKQTNKRENTQNILKAIFDLLLIKEEEEKKQLFI